MPRISRNAQEKIVQLNELIKTEIANLRAERDQVLADAKSRADALESRAAAMEAKIGSLPAELVALPDEGAARVWEWFKGLF